MTTSNRNVLPVWSGTNFDCSTAEHTEFSA